MFSETHVNVVTWERYDLGFSNLIDIGASPKRLRDSAEGHQYFETNFVNLGFIYEA